MSLGSQGGSQGESKEREIMEIRKLEALLNAPRKRAAAATRLIVPSATTIEIDDDCDSHLLLGCNSRDLQRKINASLRKLRTTSTQKDVSFCRYFDGFVLSFVGAWGLHTLCPNAPVTFRSLPASALKRSSKTCSKQKRKTLDFCLNVRNWAKVLLERAGMVFGTRFVKKKLCALAALHSLWRFLWKIFKENSLASFHADPFSTAHNSHITQWYEALPTGAVWICFEAPCAWERRGSSCKPQLKISMASNWRTVKV